MLTAISKLVEIGSLLLMFASLAYIFVRVASNG